MRSNSSILIVMLAATLLSSGIRAADSPGPEDGVLQLQLRAVYLEPNHTTYGYSNNLAGKLYPELSGEWFLGPSWSTELTLGAGTDFSLTAGDSIRLWPLTWTVKYQFARPAGFGPYLGAGLHHTWSSLNTIPSDHSGIDSSSTGGLVQAGADMRLTASWFVNADVRYLGGLEPRNLLYGTYFPGAGRYKIDPFLFSLGVAYRWH
ncbi:MAG: OmpW family protein [Gammaproteobacteria bacterium]|nr:MAG: OmpW family protein [Gammaproteobacteria bacterium]